MGNDLLTPESIGLALGGAWAVWLQIVHVCSRINREIPDTRLGRAAGVIHRIAGATKHGANAEESK